MGPGSSTPTCVSSCGNVGERKKMKRLWECDLKMLRKEGLEDDVEEFLK